MLIGIASASARTVLHASKFPGTNLPGGWVKQGAWTVDGKLISPTGTGGNATNVCFWSQHIAQNDQVWECRFIIRDPCTRFAMIRRDQAPILSPGGQASSWFEIQADTGLLILRSTWTDVTSPTLPAIAAQQSIGFSLVTNRIYIGRFSVADPDNKKMSVTDTLTGETAELVTANTSAGGDGCDSPGFAWLKGSVEILSCVLYSTQPNRVHLVVAGHSFVQAATLAPGRSNSYARLLATSLGWLDKRVVIAGQGGESPTSLNTRTNTDVGLYWAKYALIDCAHNESVFSNWLAKSKILATVLTNRGTIPIFATPTPYPPRQAYLNEVAAFLRTNNLGWKVADFAKVTGDETQIPEFFTLDAIHPNKLGHAAMFEEIWNAVPELWADPDLPANLTDGNHVIASASAPGWRRSMLRESGSDLLFKPANGNNPRWQISNGSDQFTPFDLDFPDLVTASGGMRIGRSTITTGQMRMEVDRPDGTGTNVAMRFQSSADNIIISTNGLLIPPRMTSAQRDAITGPTNGGFFYNTTTEKWQGRAGGAWVDWN